MFLVFNDNPLNPLKFNMSDKEREREMGEREREQLIKTTKIYIP